MATVETMAWSVPLIFSPRSPAAFLSVAGRLGALSVSCGCCGLLGVAAWLTPDTHGLGTHTRLHLAPCQFQVRTGLPCPTCGMTTSFAWFARGNLLASLYVQPMGMVLALLTAMGFWLGLYIAVSGRPVHRLLERLPVKYFFIPLVAWGILAWGWKIFIHLHGMDGWG